MSIKMSFIEKLPEAQLVRKWSVTLRHRSAGNSEAFQQAMKDASRRLSSCLATLTGQRLLWNFGYRYQDDSSTYLEVFGSLSASQSRVVALISPPESKTSAKKSGPFSLALSTAADRWA